MSIHIIAKEIAMDHLVEYPYYYDELEQMEKKFEYIRGKEMKRYKSVFNKVKEDEEDKSVKAVKDLIDLDWEADEDSKHKAVAMIQGLFTADTKVGNDFLKQLSDFTSGLKIEDFKEGCKKNPKKKDMKEAFRFSNPNTASSILQDSIVYLSNYYDITHPKFIRSVAFAILNGLTASVEHKFISDENNDPSNEKKQNKLVKTTLSKIFSYIKGRI